MSEFTPADAGHVARTALFWEWKELIDSGSLTEEGLLRIRGRLLGEDNEFEPGPDRDWLLIHVTDALAAMLDVDPADVPGSPLAVPDSPAGLDDDA